MLRKALVIMMSIISLSTLVGCVDYGYKFHYSVIGGNGEITVEEEVLLDSVYLCSEVSWCEIDCHENSHIIRFLGSKNGSHEIVFIAIPDEGYKVKEWLFNGEIVIGNKTNSYTASVSKEHNYNGVIAVRFERI